MSSAEPSVPSSDQSAGSDRFLFWACFIALIATAFGFIIRAFILDDWAVQFGLSETQKGEIQGAGLWPFAISIVLFSLVVDKIGYGKAMAFAFICHMASAIITISASNFANSGSGYWILYVGTFIGALGNGTVEAVINPVVATMFVREKTKWLNILHAGWPGGLVLGGLIALMMGADVHWTRKVALVFIPVVAYGLMMLRCKFPVQERVAAGVPYKAMLQEVGILGALIVVGLMVREVGRVFAWPTAMQIGVAAVLVAAYGAYVRSLGRPMFIFLVLIMIPLATTELGTDSWITSLMRPEMQELGLQAGWVLVYTSFIMMVLRFLAGPIVHKLSPLGLLAVSALIAAVGLMSLSKAAGLGILAAATLYGFGKTFFWPTMLGVVSERFPKGGALTLNTIAAVGMLGVGVVGNAFLGNIQDKGIDKNLLASSPTLHERVIGEQKQSVFGRYRALDSKKVNPINDAVALYEERQRIAGSLPPDATEGEIAAKLAADNKYRRLVQVAYDNNVRAEGDEEKKSHEVMAQALKDNKLVVTEESYAELKKDKGAMDDVMAATKKNALATVAIFPVIMLVCYLSLILYFRAQGGYKAEVLTGHEAVDEKFTGGVEGPVE